MGRERAQKCPFRERKKRRAATWPALHHSNDRPLICQYGPANTEVRGETVQVNIFTSDGRLIECNEVERLANEERISLRAGCHCNPGAREVALSFTKDDLEACFRD